MDGKVVAAGKAAMASIPNLDEALVRIGELERRLVYAEKEIVRIRNLEKPWEFTDDPHYQRHHNTTMLYADMDDGIRGLERVLFRLLPLIYGSGIEEIAQDYEWLRKRTGE